MLNKKQKIVNEIKQRILPQQIKIKVVKSKENLLFNFLKIQDPKPDPDLKVGYGSEQKSSVSATLRLRSLNKAILWRRRIFGLLFTTYVIDFIRIYNLQVIGTGTYPSGIHV